MALNFRTGEHKQPPACTGETNRHSTGCSQRRGKNRPSGPAQGDHFDACRVLPWVGPADTRTALPRKPRRQSARAGRIGARRIGARRIGRGRIGAQPTGAAARHDPLFAARCGSPRSAKHSAASFSHAGSRSEGALTVAYTVSHDMVTLVQPRIVCQAAITSRR